MEFIKAATFMCLAALLLGGCTQVTYINVQPDTHITVPTGGSTAKFKPQQTDISSVGDYMITDTLFTQKTMLEKRIRLAATLNSPLNIVIPHKLRSFKFTFEPAELAYEGSSSFGMHFRYPKQFTSKSGDPAIGGIVMQPGSQMASRIYWNWTDRPAGDYYTAPFEPGQIVTTTVVDEQEVEFENLSERTTQALIYSGLSDGKIRLIYHEFTPGGHLKPNFKQVITLDYKPGEEYAFKKARFVLIRASVAEIEFRLIRGL